jgi:hypothetical protein
MRDEFRLAHLDGETPLEVFADFCDWSAFKLLGTPRIQRSSDADAVDESSVSLNGNQQEEDRDEGDDCLQRTSHVARIFSDASVAVSTLTMLPRSKSQKTTYVDKSSVHGRSVTSK